MLLAYKLRLTWKISVTIQILIKIEDTVGPPNTADLGTDEKAAVLEIDGIGSHI